MQSGAARSSLTLPVSALVVLLVPVAGAAAGGAPLGTWKGRIVQRVPTYTSPSITLSLTARGADTRFTGLTGAAHDSPTATTTCSVRYKRAGNRGGWLYYEQSGPSHVPSATGGVEGAPCGAPGKRLPGWAGYLLRVRSIRGGKLAVQVTTWDQAPKTLDETVSMLSHPFWRAYLTR
jgi:hypothetical protein